MLIFFSVKSVYKLAVGEACSLCICCKLSVLYRSNVCVHVCHYLILHNDPWERCKISHMIKLLWSVKRTKCLKSFLLFCLGENSHKVGKIIYFSGRGMGPNIGPKISIKKACMHSARVVFCRITPIRFYQIAFRPWSIRHSVRLLTILVIASPLKLLDGF